MHTLDTRWRVGLVTVGTGGAIGRAVVGVGRIGLPEWVPRFPPFLAHPCQPCAWTAHPTHRPSVPGL